MNKRTKYAGGACAVALAMGSAILPATAALADGDYHGVWTLEAYKINGTKVTCPGSLPTPPPAPPIACKAGEYLKLKDNYRYRTTLSAFVKANSTGDFGVIELDGGHHHKGARMHTIVFDSDDANDDPRAYTMRLQGYGSGIPTKMVISIAVGVGGGKVVKTNMVFRRDS